MASIALPATLTLADASATLAGLLEAIAADPSPVLDATGLQTLDSAAVAVLLQCRRSALAAGKDLQIVGAPPKLAQLAQLYGVDELIAAQPAAAAAGA
jgi:phospholipid transport system transporter-binding protein